MGFLSALTNFCTGAASAISQRRCYDPAAYTRHQDAWNEGVVARLEDVIAHPDEWSDADFDDLLFDIDTGDETARQADAHDTLRDVFARGGGMPAYGAGWSWEGQQPSWLESDDEGELL